MCEFREDHKWSLVYRASKDGFLARDFHRKCDGIKYTLTVIKTTTGNIFGGFTNRPWLSDKKSYKDYTGFIFSLANKDCNPFKVKCYSNNAIACNRLYGPAFGGNFNQQKLDVCIFSNSNKNTKSYSDFGFAYVNKDYRYGEEKTKAILAGSEYFKTTEIEVYKQVRHRDDYAR